MAKILIVDDDQLTLNLVESCVKDLCSEVYTALDAKTGWATYQEVKPDLVITDYGMPKIDGYVFACMIEEDDRQCPVILVTSYNNIDEKLKSQFTHVFPKPLDIEQFQKFVKDIIKLW